MQFLTMGYDKNIQKKKILNQGLAEKKWAEIGYNGGVKEIKGE